MTTFEGSLSTAFAVMTTEALPIREDPTTIADSVELRDKRNICIKCGQKGNLCARQESLRIDAYITMVREETGSSRKRPLRLIQTQLTGYVTIDNLGWDRTGRKMCYYQ